MTKIISTNSERPPRYPALDALRGAAIVGVVLFHLVWDLTFLGFISPEWAAHPAWIAFGRLLAATFMTLVGVSLALATRHGVRVPAVLRRLAILAAAAAAITAATRLTFPEAYVYFGILHSIVVATVVGLALIRAPLPAVVAVGLALIVAGSLWTHPAFDPRALAWIGFSETPAPSNDHAPVFPWAGFTLLGLAAGRACSTHGWFARSPAMRTPTGRFLAVAGRRSLAIYLVHQPVLLAILVPAATILR